jgi:hypothetical protein
MEMYTYIKKIVFRLIDGTLMEVSGEEATHMYNFVLGNEDIVYIEFEVGEARRMVPRSSIVYLDVTEHEKANNLAQRMDRLYEAILVFGKIKKDINRWRYWAIDQGKLYYFAVGLEPVLLSEDIGVVKQAEMLLYLQTKLDEIIPPAQQKEIV